MGRPAKTVVAVVVPEGKAELPGLVDRAQRAEVVRLQQGCPVPVRRSCVAPREVPHIKVSAKWGLVPHAW